MLLLALACWLQPPKQLPHPTLQVPSGSGSATWNRRAVKEATGVMQGTAYATRQDTEGVASPNCAGVAIGEAVLPNYQAV